MATGEQIKTLIKAHYAQDNDRFKSAALRIAASETKMGHVSLGKDILSIVQQGDHSPAHIINLTNKDGLFLVSFPEIQFSSLVVSDGLRDKIQRIIDEYRNRERLASYGLSCRRKVLLEGAPGTGKTMTASVIASEFALPLYTVQADKLITKYLGETSVKLRQVFETISSSRGVFFFDEFDAIGADRMLDNEVGEMRRILNSFLQFIENDSSDSIIIAATNSKQMLDQALFRRFDDVLHYELPTTEEAKALVKQKVRAYDPKFSATEKTAEMLVNLSQAEITRLCDDAVKESLLSGKRLSNTSMQSLCKDRLSIYGATPMDRAV